MARLGRSGWRRFATVVVVEALWAGFVVGPLGAAPRAQPPASGEATAHDGDSTAAHLPPLSADGGRAVDLVPAIRTAADGVVAIGRGPKQRPGDHFAPSDSPEKSAAGGRLPPTASTIGELPDGWKAFEYGLGLILGDRLILTPYHALGNVSQSTYRVWGRQGLLGPAAVRGADPWSDLAVLEVDGPGPWSPIDWAPVPPGIQQPVVVLTDPWAIVHGQGPVAVASRVAAIGQVPSTSLAPSSPDEGQPPTLYHLGGLLALDPPLPGGSSGAAVVNSQGKLIAMASSAAAMADYRSAASYALPVDPTLRRIVDRLRAGEPAEYGFLGVALDLRVDGQELDAAPGVVVRQVVPGTPAFEAGLMAGDRILEVDGRPVESPNHFLLMVGQNPPGTNLTLQVQREEGIFRRDQMRQLSVQLSKKYINTQRPVVTSVPPRRWRGIEVEYPSATADFHRLVARLDTRGCVVVVDVLEGSPAWQAGLRAGMLVAEVGGRRVRTPEDFYRVASQSIGPTSLTLVDRQVVTVATE